jgi:hypothetical protein
MTVIVDNTGFSVQHWSRFTEAEFIEQNMKQMAFKQHSEADRRSLLSFAYKQVQDDVARNAKEAERV